MGGTTYCNGTFASCFFGDFFCTAGGRGAPRRRRPGDRTGKADINRSASVVHDVYGALRRSGDALAARLLGDGPQPRVRDRKYLSGVLVLELRFACSTLRA